MKVIDKRGEKQKTRLSDIPQGSWFETDQGLLGLRTGQIHITDSGRFISCLVHMHDSWLIDNLPVNTPCQALHTELVILD